MSLLALLSDSVPVTPPPSTALGVFQARLAQHSSQPVVITVAGDSLTDMDAATIDSTGWSPTLARKLRARYGEPVSFHDVGDTAGWDATPTRTAGIHVVNVAQSGATSYNYLAGNKQGNLQNSWPSLTCHMIGMNNYSFTTNTPQNVANDIQGRMVAIDAALTAAGAPSTVHAVMVEPRRTPPMPERPADWWDVYGTELQARVNNKPSNRMLINIDAAFGATSGLRGDDGIHLTAAGYELVAQTVFDYITQ